MFAWLNLPNFLMTLLGFSGLFLIGLILLQRGRGGGLVSSICGRDGHSFLGPRAGDVFTRITIVAFVAWALLSGGSVVALHKSGKFVPDSVFQQDAGTDLGKTQKGPDSTHRH